MQYLKPEMDVLNLEVMDIITTSVTEVDDGTIENEGSVITPEGSWG